jgi:hypothetical protein
MRVRNFILLGITLVAAAACDVAESAPSARSAAPAGSIAAPVPPAAAAPVDSYVPPEEALRRFRRGIANAPTRLSGGAPTRDSLVRLLVHAIARRDTALVNRVVLTRAEFAYLYYPTAPLARPPYELDPQMMWLQLVSQSEKGIVRAFDRLGGTAARYAGHACADAERQGDNRVWSGCTVTLARAGGGDTTRQRLFGSIVERGGRFKFVSYANDM